MGHGGFVHAIGGESQSLWHLAQRHEWVLIALLVMDFCGNA